MKISNIIALGITLLAVSVIAGYVKKCADTKRMLNQIADEGYETAHDVLFPGKRLGSKNLQYGPVIPALS
jgi:hypothetical protein